MSTSVAVVLDKRSKSKKGFPLKLRLMHLGAYYYISLKMYLNEKEYKKVRSNIKLTEELNLINQKMIKAELRANQILNNMEDYNFQQFKSIFTDKKEKLKKSDSVTSLFNYRIGEFKASGKLKSSNTYECALKAIERFKPNLKLQQIDSKYLNSFQTFLISENKSITTVSIYMRNLRAIINANKELIHKYPFDNYKIPTANNNKRAISEENLQKILSYKFKKETDNFYLDIFKFSFYVGGANLKDIALLKKSNIQGDFLIYSRAKTNKQVKIFLIPEAKEIIEKYSTLSDLYLFPLITSEEPEYMFQRTHGLTKRINSRLKTLCEKLNIKKVTTYSARHSFATLLMNKGVSIAFISQSLGHSSISTTQNYLGSFTDEQMKEGMSKLV